MQSIISIDEAIKTHNNVDYKEVARQLLWLQHERLIHLLVMLTTGLAILIITLVVTVIPSLTLGILALILGVLFFMYLLYYRRLELMVYRWYDYLSKTSNQ